MITPQKLVGTVLALMLTSSALADKTIVPYSVVERYKHCTRAFTQGLQIVGDEIYESSGRYGASYVARWRLDCTETAPRHSPPATIFAEGLAVHGDSVFLLSWKNGEGFVLDAKTLEVRNRFSYTGEGWGLVHTGTALIMSDGTAQLRFLDPQTFAVQKTVEVREGGKPLLNLNELEWIPAGALAPQPRLLANIWQTDQVAVIDPESGEVTARILMRNVHPMRWPDEDEMNGIALDPRDNTLLVTGKRWRHISRIRLNAPLP